jgi:hypothetical protein
MGLVHAKLMLRLVVSTTLGAEGGPGVSVEFKKWDINWMLVAHAYNPSYSGGSLFEASPGK